MQTIQTFCMFGHTKLRKGVIHAAQKVGEVTQKGIEKIRPSAHQALDNAKQLSSQGAAQAKHTGQQLANNVNTKIQETKEVITGQSDHAVPIYQVPLSAPSQNIAPTATHHPHLLRKHKRKLRQVQRLKKKLK